MKLKKGDIVRFDFPSIRYSANKWAKAIYQGTTYTDQDGGELISVKWIRDGNDNDQKDGEYYSHMFVKLEEVSTQEEDRILKENKKVMKFDLEKGKEQLLTWMDNEFDCTYGNSLQYIKELSTIADIQDEVESFRRFEESWVGKTAAVNRATTMREIFEALKDTAIEDDDNFIIELFTTEQ
jgi:predicted restriction endonuclease